MFKTFAVDRLVRDCDGRPLGRAVLVDNYVEGQDLKVARLEVPKTVWDRHEPVYVDGMPYVIPLDTPPIKFTKRGANLIINTFLLKKQ